MGLTGFQRQRRILDGMTPEDDTKPGQITTTEFTNGTPDEIQRPPEDRIEGVEIPGNQFVDEGRSVAPESEGVEEPDTQSADPSEPNPGEDAPQPVKTAEHKTDVGGEPEGPDAEAPSASVDDAEWALKSTPAEYLERYPDGKHADLARRLTANG